MPLFDRHHQFNRSTCLAGYDAVRMSTSFAVQAKMNSTLPSRRGLTRQAAVCVVNPTRLSVGYQLDLQSLSYVVNRDVCDLGRFAEEARFHSDGDIGIENRAGRDGFSSRRFERVAPVTATMTATFNPHEALLRMTQHPVAQFSGNSERVIHSPETRAMIGVSLGGPL